MTNSGWHLAQFNVARLRQPLEHPDTAGFIAGLEPINAFADSSPGFVWRLQDESGQSSSYVRAYAEPLMIINLSVWETPDDLRTFVFKTAHTEFLRRRREWFERMGEAFLVCWWVPAGEVPSVADAVDRLTQLQREGPSLAAFTLRDTFPAPAAATSRFHGAIDVEIGIDPSSEPV